MNYLLNIQRLYFLKFKHHKESISMSLVAFFRIRIGNFDATIAIIK